MMSSLPWMGAKKNKAEFFLCQKMRRRGPLYLYICKNECKKVYVQCLWIIIFANKLLMMMMIFHIYEHIKIPDNIKISKLEHFILYLISDILNLTTIM
jgi:hypothetical protein